MHATATDGVASHEEVQRQMVRTLLIELMAYQFASPVRWIETQDVILSDYKAQRIVEIGPAPVLVGMIKRTIETKRKTRDLATGLQRQLLWPEKDTKDVYCEPEPVPLTPDVPTQTEKTASSTPQTTSQQPISTSAPAPTAVAQVKLAPVEDRLPSAREVLFVLLSKGLKISVGQVTGSKSLKALTGGRSTLENEIVGDLGAEFGSLPDRAEDMPVTELADTLQGVFQGQLGKKATTFLNSLIASKMPVSFNLAATRKYLQSRWGLGSGRQDSVLLLAIATPPPSRIEADKNAEEFLDQLVRQYATEHGLSLDSPTSSSGPSSGDAVTLDPATLSALMGGNQDLSKNLLGVYAKHLGLDLDHDKRTLEEFHTTVEAALRQELNQVTLELGEEFTSGVQPRFNSHVIRSYDSSWAWALQDLLQLYYEIVKTPPGQGEAQRRKIAERCSHIALAAEPAIIQVIEHMTLNIKELQPSMVSFLQDLKKKCQNTILNGPAYHCTPSPVVPRVTVDAQGNVKYTEVEDTANTSLFDLATSPQLGKPSSHAPHLHIKRRVGHVWKYSESLTSVFRGALEKAQTGGESFSGRSVLITGAGTGSIGAEMLAKLLSGGARIIVTTTRFSPEVAGEYQKVYTDFGARGSQLVVVPFNQGSVQDINALVDYIYDLNGLNWDLDYVIPFAAIAEGGSTIDKIGHRSELAHRIMLINLLRLLGAIKTRKAARGSNTSPTQVILPLSPNHGGMGGDGLYGESKLGLETLFERWHSEDWSDYLSICGAVIGWTRGTGLMNHNDLVAEGIERLGVKTFSKSEMAHFLICLMFSDLAARCEEEPLYADLSGRMGQLPNLKDMVQNIRNEINETAETRRMILQEDSLESECFNTAQIDKKATSTNPKPSLTRKAYIKLDFPSIPDYDTQIGPLTDDLHGMLDLERVIVITGFGEIGPWGNSRTRWEMEAYGEFSLEGCIEMAWLMNMIKYVNGPIKGKAYYGWVDSKTGDPVADLDVKKIYEKRILEHSGVRLLEPEIFEGYNPEKKQTLHEVFIQEDLQPLEVPEATAQQLKLEHGDKVDVLKLSDSDLYRVTLRKGAKLFIPKAIKYHQLVVGQIPTGWNPKLYGIPDDIISQVDPVSLFTLVSTVEALLSSGITDPYEVYKHIHVSEAGNCIGSGIGGFQAFQRLFKLRYIEKDIQGDILQEAFINTVGAWVNMLLMSASGPNRTPVGACATALESLELGCDTIISGKAKFCLVGGVDDLQEESTTEFANLQATSNSAKEFERGRSPREMSRPTATSRAGFMESHGAGIQVITSAKLALEMGLPIRGVVAFCETAMDKAGRSLPAPGKGLLSKAREVPYEFPSPLLDISSRRKKLESRRAQISDSRKAAIQELNTEVSHAQGENPAFNSKAFFEQQMKQIDEQALQEERDAQFAHGNFFWKGNSHIAPLRGALAAWGLTVDDVNVVSFHGTSTQLNEKNECSVLQTQMTHLGRTPGNVAIGVFQKHLTGHPKGAAGAWMLNGALQILDTGLIPGNRNADNVDEALRKFDHVAFLNRSIQTDGLNAVSVLSFGFGQKGAQAICLHPKYMFATLDRSEYDSYQIKLRERVLKADRFFSRGLISQSLYDVKTVPPYAKEQEMAVLLDPTVRFPMSEK
ncbi:fatty acid synthase alpha subunit [Talaromyces proteolyticus]|uniref:Fatty acid synthase subunit alpha n=1 Tax=Talaromyces proteolyticus TaxID=1131652 RepID=A0AAD4PXR1_9EURO|nr:fatty acid synthase alpha subunit [Talaromyces proteolyticus]KAH8693925.1 fatty acid synthase alpha subunit [Talaromyces proteolyticus]